MNIHLTLGAAFHQAGPHQPPIDELIATADEAMYQQKRAGGAGWQLTQPRETE